MTAALFAAAQACGDARKESAPSGATSSGAGGSSGAGAGGAGGASTTVGSGGAGQGGLGTGGGGGCVSSPNEDKDKDGYSIAQGDCNDCDPAVNPDAIDKQPMPDADGGIVPGQDSNCDGTISPLDHCDDVLALDSNDPFDAAKAIGLCPSKFLLGAKWVLADGSEPPSDAAQLAAFHLGHGNLPDLGPNVLHQEGKQMLVLSSGTARRPGDPGFVHESFDKGYGSAPLPGFATTAPACPGVTAGAPRDAVGLELELRAPTNVKAFYWAFDFFSSGWPADVCTTRDDAFVAWMVPFPGAQTSGSISFDPMGNPITVNNTDFGICGCPQNPPAICLVPPGAPMAVKQVTCPLGHGGIDKTDFASDDADPGWTHAATGWLESAAPIEPGKTFKLRFVVYDAEDGKLDSAVAIDNWRWSTAGPYVTGGVIKPPH